MSDRAHAVLSASGSHIWLNCTKSGELSMAPDAPQRRGSVYAAEGTAAHALAETCLREGTDASLYIGLEFEGFKVDEAMADAVQVYVDHCRALTVGAQYWIEQSITLEALWTNEGKTCPTPLFGTSDFMALHMEGLKASTADTLHVVDYKHGVGVPVEAVGNTQFMYYGLGGVLHLLSQNMPLPRFVTMTVVQPRAPHSAGGVRSWTIPVLDLFVWAETVLMPAVLSVIVADTKFTTGEHCRWCPHAAQCPALRDKAFEVARTQFDDVSSQPPDPNLIPLDELGSILQHAELIAGWLSQVRAVVSEAIEKGHKIRGWKLVPKRATRKWSDETQASATLSALSMDAEGDFFTTPTLKSPAQVEQVLKRRKTNLAATGLDQFVVAESSGTTLAPDTDDRPALATGARAVFDNSDL